MKLAHIYRIAYTHVRPTKNTHSLGHQSKYKRSTYWISNWLCATLLSDFFKNLLFFFQTWAVNFAKHKITTEAWITTVKKKSIPDWLTGSKDNRFANVLSLLGHP